MSSPFVKPSDSAIEAGLFRIPLRTINGIASAHSQPISFGVPLPSGAIAEPPAGRLEHTDGAELPVQLETLSRWPDRSVKWLLVDAILPPMPAGGDWSLVLGPELPTPPVNRQIKLHQSGDAIRVDSGPMSFRIDGQTLQPWASVTAVDAGINWPSSDVVLLDRRGRRHVPEPVDWKVAAAGPLRTTLIGRGRYPKLRGLRLELTLTFYAATGIVRLDVLLHNPRRAKHPGGIWDLGDPGSVLFQDLSIEIALPNDFEHDLSYTLDHGAAKIEFATITESWRLYQDSSGGENWNSLNHVNREGRVPCRFRGYRLSANGRERAGLRAEPVVTLEHLAGGSFTIAIPEFWQQFPKALDVDCKRMRVGLFPREFDDLHELQGGEQKSHTIWLQFAETKSTPLTFAWTRSPTLILLDLGWCDTSQCLPRLSLSESAEVRRLNSYLEESLSGKSGLLANRERVDEYGWRSYGDVFADHEQAYYRGPQPLISHYNNQFDMIFGFLLHFLRTGERRYWELGDALARHVVDIDLYHTQEDKAAYNGGLFWLTDHYLHAHTSTHRTYSRHNRPAHADYGGGPGAEHNYTSGLLLHHWLTGSRHSRDAVLQLADWVISMDDGRRTIFGIVDDGATGIATGGIHYQGPSRAGGNSINALLDAWLLSGRDEYMRYAEQLIRRCVHPEDNVGALNLLDVERKWSYTIFLSSLAKYIDLKFASVGWDEMTEYAARSFLTYAEWMLEHERPYFDQPEQLEYPTEAWAAQEFRKANVLRLAARYAAEPLRSALIGKGTQLAERAWRDLLSFETRTTARAFAILMVEGLTDCRLRSPAGVPEMPIRGVHHIAVRRPFITQRRRIAANLRSFHGIMRMGLRVANPQGWRRYLKFRHGRPAVHELTNGR